jgi:aspartate/methionine/tyrosine aminotransferase
VFGSGGTQLLHAFIYAFHMIANNPVNIYARTPYYQYYRLYSEMNPSWGTFNSSTSMNPNNVLEFVAIPNNPDGSIHPRAYYTDAAYQVYDMVYYWRHNTRNITKVSYDNVLFSLSKMTGHSSSRFGWAFVRDPIVAKYMIEYVWLSTHGVSIEAQWKAYVALKTILDGNGSFYTHMTQLMHARWDRLLAVIENDPKRTVTILSPKGFVVAWIRCNNAKVSCHDMFLKYNMRTNPGPTYGATESFVRFNMQGEESTFNILLMNLKRMLDNVR